MIVMIWLQILLIALNAVFACAEIAVISVNDNKLEKMAADGDRRAVRLTKLTSQPARFLATIQVAITLSGFLGSAFAAENFSEIMVEGLIALGVTIRPELLNSIAVIFITIILSYVTLVFGELVPKQIAMRKAEPIALGLASLISVIAKIFAPLVGLLTFSTNTVLHLFGIDPDVESEQVSEEEIRMMVDVGSRRGIIDHEERELIQNVFEFDDLSAGEIITHRTDVQMLDLEDSMEVWKNVIYTSDHTRYPICDGTADKIVGILNTKDYFRMEEKEDRDAVLKKAVKVPYFVPDTVKADTLFDNMKKGHHAIAVVMDEHGGMSGIITIGDLVEQLVGDLGEESEEADTKPVKKISDGTWEIHGWALLEEVEEQLGIRLDDEEEYETFSGLVLHEVGSIPQDGTVIEIDVAGLHISSVKIQDYQVETAVVSIQENMDEQGSV